MEAQYEMTKRERPYLRQDKHSNDFVQIDERALFASYRHKFIEYFFGGKDVTLSEPTAEINPFDFLPATFFISARFK